MFTASYCCSSLCGCWSVVGLNPITIHLGGDTMTNMSMQELINTASTWGLSPFLIPGKRIIMTFTCPRCNSKHMIKFVKPPDLRNKIHACKDCGYRHMSPGYKKKHGTFLTGTLDAKA